MRALGAELNRGGIEPNQVGNGEFNRVGNNDQLETASANYGNNV